MFLSPASVERTASLRRMFLDKTGTLTPASSRVDSVEVEDLVPAEHDGRIEVRVRPAADLSPASVGFSFVD